MNNDNDEGQGRDPGMGLAVQPSRDEYGHVTAAVIGRIQARTVMAYKCPRNIDDARQSLLRDARRPGFAAVAEYAKPMGMKKDPDTGEWVKNYVRGPSIRFAEAAVRAFRNVDLQATVTHETDEARTVHLEATDLEANLTYEMDVVVGKTVERRKKKDGDDILRTRTNSYGEIVFIMVATEDEVATKQAAAVSKGFRTLALRLIPGDIVEEAMDLCATTRDQADAQDPDAARKRIADAFAGLGVKPSDLAGYLDHALESCSPAELGELRSLYTAIKEGEVTWKDALAARSSERGGSTGDDAGKQKAADVRDRIRRSKEKADAKKAPGGAQLPGEGGSGPGQGSDTGTDGKPAHGGNPPVTEQPDAREAFRAACTGLHYDAETTEAWATELECPLTSKWTAAQTEKARKAVAAAGGRM